MFIYNNYPHSNYGVLLLIIITHDKNTMGAAPCCDFFCNLIIV